jgi:hypothetical protein
MGTTLETTRVTVFALIPIFAPSRIEEKGERLERANDVCFYRKGRQLRSSTCAGQVYSSHPPGHHRDLSWIYLEIHYRTNDAASRGSEGERKVREKARKGAREEEEKVKTL